MNVNAELVLHIARLAHLDLSESEVELFTRQLQDILQYIEKLNEVSHTGGDFEWNRYLPGFTRPDQSQASLPAEDALKNAQQSTQQLFRVPRILP